MSYVIHIHSFSLFLLSFVDVIFFLCDQLFFCVNPLYLKSFILLFILTIYTHLCTLTAFDFDTFSSTVLPFKNIFCCYFHCLLVSPLSIISLFPPTILLFLFSPCPSCGLFSFFFLSIGPLLCLFPPFYPNSSFSLFCPYLSTSRPHPLPPSLPTVRKWLVARVPAWTGTPLGAVALPGPNSPALVVMWTSSRLLPRQQHLPRLSPSTSIRKMEKTL